MSESLGERLSRLTPDGAGLDRAALLFAAGRASARPSRRWRALCGVLAASQLLTVALLYWQRPADPGGFRLGTDLVTGTIIVAPAARSEPEPPVHGGSELWQLNEPVIASEGKLPIQASATELAPANPSLHAIGALPPTLVN